MKDKPSTRLPLTMEVQCGVLECVIVVIGLLRSLLFDVCVKCGIGVSEAVCGKCQMSETTGVRSGCLVEEVCCSDQVEHDSWCRGAWCGLCLVFKAKVELWMAELQRLLGLGMG